MTHSYPRIGSPEYDEMYGLRARSTDPETSKAAGRAVDASGQRGEIMYLMQCSPVGPEGWTADEIDETIGWRVTTAGRRLSELKRRGLVEPCGERRTRSNRMATVYRVTS